MEENQVRENIEDYKFSFKNLFLTFKTMFSGEKNNEENKILEEVAKIQAQESPRIQELCNNLENHQVKLKKGNNIKKADISIKNNKIEIEEQPKKHSEDEKIQEI